MKTSLNGFNEAMATFKAEGLPVVSGVVKLSDDMTVSQCADGDKFIGVCAGLESGYACVQLSGYATVSYTGTAPALGCAKLSADGKGGVKADENGREHIVTDVDTTKKTAGIIL